MFTISNDDPTLDYPRETMGDFAQIAEVLHASDGQPRTVVATADDPHGFYVAGETVYTSKGAVE